MHLRILFSFTAFLSFGALNAFSLIHETSSYDPIIEAVSNASEDTLVIFGIENVLIQAKDSIFRFSNKKNLLALKESLSKKHPPEKVKTLWSKMLKSRTSQLLDNKALSLMNLIKAKNFWAIALTSPCTERTRIFTDYDNNLIQELANLKIDFFRQSPTSMRYSLKGFSGKGPPPAHKNGIIFTRNIETSLVLEKFLSEFQVNPIHIIFIDDQRKNLISIEKMCQEKNIIFNGFLYTKGHQSLRPYNEEIVQMQLLTLEKEDTWLSDYQACRKTKLLKDPCKNQCH